MVTYHVYIAPLYWILLYKKLISKLTWNINQETVPTQSCSVVENLTLYDQDCDREKQGRGNILLCPF